MREAMATSPASVAPATFASELHSADGNIGAALGTDDGSGSGEGGTVNVVAQAAEASLVEAVPQGDLGKHASGSGVTIQAKRARAED